MQRSTITAVLVTSFVFTGLTGFVSSATQDTGTQIQLCVNNRTKAVTYSKSWSKCPSGSTAVKVGQIGPQGLPGAQGPQGVMGPSGPSGPSGSSGSNGSSVAVWDSLKDCNQKLNFALASGYLMATKRDRSDFEAKTGCIVESIFPTFRNSIYQKLNYPDIAGWEFVSFNGVTEGDGAYGVSYYGSGLARYKVTLTDMPEGFSFCELDAEDKVTASYYVETTPDGKAVIDARLAASQSNFYAQLEVGITSNPAIGCSVLGDVEGHFVQIFEDPARFLGTSHFQDHLAWWGWK